jgi:hydrogenase maturation protein HypF
VADAFLHHDRPIVRPADDPVCRRIAGRVRPIRIGRGSAPLEIDIGQSLPHPVLAAGAHMKGTLALAWDNRVVVSPHIGEMDSPRSLAVFEQVAADLQALYGVTAESLICDAHSGYTTHRWAKAQGLPVTEVWHHEAHASALTGESRVAGSWLVFAWDGVGLGSDGTLWGGETLAGSPGRWQRVASLRPFRLPGGDAASREPWRSAAAVGFECGYELVQGPEAEFAHAAWQRGVNAQQTSAVGRLFDAAAAIVSGIHKTSFEAQAPMMMESMCREPRSPVSLPLYRDQQNLLRSDWQPLIDVMRDASIAERERTEIFHSSMAQAIVDQALALRDRYGLSRVGLTGGVFMNRVLCEQAVNLLESSGFRVQLQQALPCNDAAISFGQVVEFAGRQTGVS